MLRFVVRKAVHGLGLVFVVSVIAFVLLSAAGGDALTALSENPQVSEETVDRLRAVYGLDEPVATRYLSWLGGFLRGDLGESFVYRTPVLSLALSKLFNTAILAVTALALALWLSIPAAYLIRLSRSRSLETAADIIVSVTASTPRIVAALVALLLLVSVSRLSAAPVERSPIILLLAGCVMALPLIAVFLAQAKGELSRALTLTFVQFARSKGLSERSVIFRHAFREALNPLLTLFGLSIGSLVSGSVVVETILGWPGIGALTVTAVRGRDVPLVMGIVIMTSIAVWLGNSLAEMLQMVNDPRLRADEASTDL